MNIRRFAAGFGRLPQRSRSFGVQPRIKHDPLPQAALHHYWHPNRPSVEPAPSHVARELTDIHPKLRLVRPPAGAPIHNGFHPWILWFEDELVRHALCPGWKLVLIWENPYTKEPLPLDNRLYANVFMRDSRQFASAVKYFEGCVSSMQHTEQQHKARFKQESYDRQKGLRDYQKIKNIGMGNKFALHHDGTNIPSRSETNWRTDTLYDRLPEDVRQLAEKEGKNTRRAVTSARDSGSRADHAAFVKETNSQLEMLKLLRERRELVGRRLTRSSVGFTGASR